MTMEHPFMQNALNEYSGHQYQNLNLSNNLLLLQASYRNAAQEQGRPFFGYEQFLMDPHMQIPFVRLSSRSPKCRRASSPTRARTSTSPTASGGRKETKERTRPSTRAASRSRSTK